MRIAHFIQRFPPARGGSEAYFARLSHYLTGAGDDVTVWTTIAKDLSGFWSPAAECFTSGVERHARLTVKRFPLWRMRGRRWLLKPLSMLPLRTWQALTLPCNPISLRMWREAAETTERYDAVHATAFPYAWPIMCARRLARRQNIPLLVTPFLHLGDSDNPRDPSRRAYTQPALRRLLLSADRVFAQTQHERDVIIELGVRPERVILQGLGVDPSECTGGDRQATRAAWGIADDEVVVGHLANLSAEKGSIDLIKAAERCGHCVLALAGPAMPNFENFMRSDHRMRILRLGELTEPQKRDFFAAIDVFALPSRSDSFGLVLLEAWANGLPNVGYRAGGPGAILRHGHDGLLAKCGDIADLAKQLQCLINSSSLKKNLGTAGRERLPTEFHWPDKLQLVQLAMQEAVEERQRSLNSISA